MMIRPLFRRFEASRPFTEQEAWLLFRTAAIGEACGWTLLIGGLAIERFVTPGNSTAVAIAGQIHGTIFLAYLVAALGLYPSLGWSRWRGVVALMASIPPYGTLVFEQWAAHTRRNFGFKSYRHFLVYTSVLLNAQEQ